MSNALPPACLKALALLHSNVITESMRLAFFQIETVERLVVALSKKIGGFSIYLGVMMLLNLLLFLKGRKHAMNKDKIINNENADI